MKRLELLWVSRLLSVVSFVELQTQWAGLHAPSVG